MSLQTWSVCFGIAGRCSISHPRAVGSVSLGVPACGRSASSSRDVSLSMVVCRQTISGPLSICDGVAKELPVAIAVVRDEDYRFYVVSN